MRWVRPLEPVHSYTDAKCTSIGSCLQGCPTDGGKSTQNTYIADALAAGKLELRPDSRVDRVVIEDGEAKGVEYTGKDGKTTRVDAGAVVVAAGTLNTPQLLMRSGLPDSPSSRLVGRNLGFHPARLVYGLFDEPQDNHMVYPITAHAMKHQHDEDGGFVVEATTIQDPIGFATTVEDESGPLWGEPLVETLKAFRRWVGVLAMVNDDNNGSVHLDENGQESFAADFNTAERDRMAGALDFSRRVLLEAGASRVVWTGLITTHVQGTCRMGSDPGAVGRRRGRTVVGREAALRRRRLARSADALRQSVADDHGACRPRGRASRRRSARLPVVTERRPRAPVARRAADAEAGGEPLLLPRAAGHGGRRQERRLGLPARLRRLRAVVGEADRRRGVGGRPHRVSRGQPGGAGAAVAALEASGAGGEWLDGDLGHGAAYSFLDPDGHRFELFYESERYVAPPELRPALKNQPSRYPGRGAGVRHLDHVNFLAVDPAENRVFLGQPRSR